MILKEAGRPNPDDPERCSRPEVALVELEIRKPPLCRHLQGGRFTAMPHATAGELHLGQPLAMGNAVAWPSGSQGVRARAWMAWVGAAPALVQGRWRFRRGITMVPP